MKFAGVKDGIDGGRRRGVIDRIILRSGIVYYFGE